MARDADTYSEKLCHWDDLNDLWHELILNRRKDAADHGDI